MPKSETPTAEQVRAIGFRLCEMLGRPLASPDDATPAALRDATDALLSDDDDDVSDRDAALASALERCAAELAWLEAPPELHGLAAELRAFEASLAKSATQGVRLAAAIAAAERHLSHEAASRESALDESRAADGVPWRIWPSPEALRSAPAGPLRTLARLLDEVARARRVLDHLVTGVPHPKLRVTRGAFFPNLAQTLKAAGLATTEIHDVLYGPARGAARRAARNRIVKQMQARPDTVSVIINLGDLDEATLMRIREQLEKAGFHVLEASSSRITIATG